MIYNENLIIPGNTGLKHEPPTDPRDYVLGGGTVGDPVTRVDAVVRTRPIIFIDGHGWHDYSPSTSFQRLANGDSNGCVTFSSVHGWEYQADYYMKNDPAVLSALTDLGLIDANGHANFNKAIIYVGSDTDPSSGNTVSNVVNWVNKQGVGSQATRNWDNTWTIEQFSAPLTQAEIEDSNKSLVAFGFEHEWLPFAQQTVFGSPSLLHTPEQIIEGLKYSVIRVSVDGNYQKDAAGLIYIDNDPNYCHSIAIIDYKLNEWWLVHDHYTNQFIYFRWDYPFTSGKLFFLKKKTNYEKIQNSWQFSSLSLRPFLQYLSSLWRW